MSEPVFWKLLFCQFQKGLFFIPKDSRLEIPNMDEMHVPPGSNDILQKQFKIFAFTAGVLGKSDIANQKEYMKNLKRKLVFCWIKVPNPI